MMQYRLTLALCSLAYGCLGALLFASPSRAAEVPPTAPPVPAAKTTAPAASAAPKPASSEPEKAGNKSAEPAGPAGDAPASVRLAYKFQVGEAVYYDVVSEMEYTSRYDTVTEIATNRTESRKHFQVKSVDPDGAADLVLIIDWVRMKAKFGDEDPGVVMDSQQPGDWPKQHQHILAAVGKPQAQLKFSPHGKLLKVHEITQMGLPLAAPATAGKPAAGGEANQTFLVILPEGPISVGQSWTEKYELRVTVAGNLTQGVNLMRTYRLDSVEGRLATISVKTAVLTPIHNPQIEAQLIQREVSGKIVFDIEAGRIVSRTADVDKNVPVPFGPKTWMRAVSHHVEKLIPPPAATATNASDKTAAAVESK